MLVYRSTWLVASIAESVDEQRSAVCRKFRNCDIPQTAARPSVCLSVTSVFSNIDAVIRAYAASTSGRIGQHTFLLAILSVA